MVEARDRIGGRTFTAKLPWNESLEDLNTSNPSNKSTSNSSPKSQPVNIEMGGTWIHSSQPHIWAELNRYDLKNWIVASESLFRPGVTSLSFPNQTGSRRNVAYDPKFDAALLAFFDVDDTLGRSSIPLPFNLSTSPLNAAGLAKYDKLSVRDRTLQLLASKQITADESLYLESYMSSLALQPDPQKIGWVDCWRWFALPGHTIEGLVEAGGVWKLKHGMSDLLQRILEDVLSANPGTKFLFDTVVTALSQSSGKVTLSTSPNPFSTSRQAPNSLSAKSTILTIPLNVLPTIRIDSLSPPKLAAMQKAHCGKGYKIIALADPSVPPDASGFACGENVEMIMTMGDKRVGGGTVLVGFGSDPSFGASLSSVYKTGENRDLASALLSAFPKEVVPTSRPIRAIGFHDWSNDPFSRGTWAFHGPEFWSSHADLVLREPVGRIFFASADYAEGWKGFVDGAIEVGVQAGRRVAALLVNGATDGAKL